MYGFKAIVFQGHKTASKAFHTLEDCPTPYQWIDDVAVVIARSAATEQS